MERLLLKEITYILIISLKLLQNVTSTPIALCVIIQVPPFLRGLNGQRACTRRIPADEKGMRRRGFPMGCR